MAENGTNGTNGNEYVPSPRPHPRVKPEGAAYAERNRGTMERWFDYSDNAENYNSARPKERLNGEEARQYAEASKGVMDEMMQGYPSPPLQNTIHPRAVKGDAVENAEANKGAGMKNLIQNYGNLDIGDGQPPPKYQGPEVAEYAERNHGNMDHIINNYGVSSPPPQPPSKVSLGGQENLDKAQGPDMGPIMRMEPTPSPPQELKPQGALHKESNGSGWDEIPPAHRVRPEGEGIAVKNSSDSMFDIMRSDNPQTTPVKEPKHMPHMHESPSPKSANPPRTRPGEGMRNYEKAHNQSEMAAILRGEADNKTATPRRNNRHLQRSELW